MDNVPLTMGVDDFFDDAENITDISIPSGIEELVRIFNSVVEYPIFSRNFDHHQFKMTIGVFLHPKRLETIFLTRCAAYSTDLTSLSEEDGWHR